MYACKVLAVHLRCGILLKLASNDSQAEHLWDVSIDQIALESVRVKGRKLKGDFTCPVDFIGGGGKRLEGVP